MNSWQTARDKNNPTFQRLGSGINERRWLTKNMPFTEGNAATSKLEPH